VCPFGVKVTDLLKKALKLLIDGHACARDWESWQPLNQGSGVLGTSRKIGKQIIILLRELSFLGIRLISCCLKFYCM